jgi:hypothetical protein
MKARSGWVNDSGQAFANGPMDRTGRRIIDWADGFFFLQPHRQDPRMNYFALMTVEVLGDQLQRSPLSNGL